MLHFTPTHTTSPATFRQFTRRGYALFSCIGREVRIGMLSVATLSTATAALAQGTPSVPPQHPAPAPEQQLATTEVMGTRAPLTLAQQVRIVAVLTRQDLAQAAVASVPDILKLFAGVDVRQRGAFGIQSDISIDGGSFDQLTLLLNGIAINSPQTGHLSADFPVQITDIERVELLEGAAARVFGTQAFSGAINIVTRAGAPGLQLQAEGGSWGTWGGNAAGTLHTAHSTQHLSAGYQQSDGFTPHSAFQQAKAFYQGTTQQGGMSLQWQAGLSHKAFDANTFYSPKFPQQWEANTRYLLSVKGQTLGQGIQLSPYLSWSRAYDHFQLIRHVHQYENFHRNDVFTVGVNGWREWALGRTLLGAEMRSEAILSNNLGRPLDSLHFVPVGDAAGTSYDRRDTRAIFSFFAEHTVLLRRWTLSGGLLVNRSSSVDDRFRLYPGVDVSYRPTARLALYASWNMAMRLPTFTDLYYKSPTNRGNAGLRPERTATLRLGARYAREGLSGSAAVFYHKGTDMIDWVKYTAEDTFHATAFTLHNVGVSLDATLHFAPLWHTDTWLRSLRLSYTAMHQHRADARPIYYSNYALQYLRHKFVTTLSHRLWGDFAASWTLRVQQRAGQYERFEGTQQVGLQPYGSYALLDAKVTYTRPRYTLYLDATNITNHRYVDLGSVPQPRALFLVGARLHLLGR